MQLPATTFRLVKRLARTPYVKRGLVGLVCLCLITVLGAHYSFKSAYGAQLGYRSMQLSNNEVSATSTYALTFELASTGTIGSVAVQFCANNPTPGDICSVPGGFSASSAVLASQTGMTGFSISPVSTGNKIILSRTSAVATPGAARYEFQNITNPSTPGPYFVRLLTYATDDATGASSDYGGIAFQIGNSVAITALVPPYLIFCTGVTIPGYNCANADGNYVDFGELSPSRSKSGTSQMLVATNAVDGYNVSVQGTALTSGNNVIAALVNGDVSRPGTAQFGFNLRSNSAPSVGANPTGAGTGQPLNAYGQPNIYRFASGETLISHSQPDDVRLYTASYIANVPANQAAGVYVSTLTYICLANF